MAKAVGNILETERVSESEADDGLPSRAVLRRYDRPAPRYTSYPTAPQFTAAFTAADYRAAVARSNAESRSAPLSLYVHIPFCSSPCFFCGCNKIITRQLSLADAYLHRLEREIELQSVLFPRTRCVHQLHFGGGTPTFLDIDHLSGLIGCLGRHFTLDPSPQREFSIEIDPRTVTASLFDELTALGFNRASFGVQDFDLAVQEAVNRVQPAQQTLALIEACRRAGFRSVAVDLIYGLPLQTQTSFDRTLALLLSVRPDRIAAYSYAHLPQRFKAQRRIRSDQLPSAEEKLSLLRLIVQRLTSAGYVYIGMDHFALPDDELAQAARTGTLQRNFQGYSTHAGADLVGLGMSAISRIDDCYAQNAHHLNDYNAAIDAGRLAVERGLRLTPEDRLRRDVIAALMCRGEVDKAGIEMRYGVDFDRHFARELIALQTLAADGLICLEPHRLVVTPAGRYLLRAVAKVFDAYLSEAADGAGVARGLRYSQSV